MRMIFAFLNLLVQQGEHNYPFSTMNIEIILDTLWMLPSVKEAKALFIT